MIVPFAAGGGTDVLARIIAQNLNSKWGQPVVVENQPGASGAIGTRAAMKARARRLHVVDGIDRRADGGVRQRRRRRSVRRQQGALPDRGRRGAALSAGGQPDLAGQFDGRSDPAGKGKAGGADVRLIRRRRGVASFRAAVCQRNRDQDAARSLQGHRSRGDRSARRAHRHDVRAGTGGAAVRGVGPAQGAGRHRHQALQILSRRAARLRSRARL